MVPENTSEEPESAEVPEPQEASGTTEQDGANHPDLEPASEEVRSETSSDKGDVIIPQDKPLIANVQLSLQLAEGARVRITVEALGPSKDGNANAEPIASTVFVSQPGSGDNGPLEVSLPLSQGQPGILVRPAPFAPSALQRFRAGWRTWPYSLQTTLFGLAIGVYLLTRLIGLTNFPIYFFTDEAVQTVLASDLIRDNFKNYAGDFLPTYFENGGKYRLSTSVYLQIVPYLIFGKSVFATRATSVIVSLAAALAVALILRNIFKQKYWWSGVILLSITPAWFLHSRTAFEYAIGVAFYALFLYFYLLYRCKETRFLYPALIMGVLAFYTYSPLQAVVLLSGALLLLSDLRYHWENRNAGLRGLAVVALLTLPYIRFLVTHSSANHVTMSALGSYWVQPIPFAEKLRLYLAQYVRGLSPGYWFSPNQPELIRHLMKGYGHLLQASLPFCLLGLGLAIKNIRSSAYRVVLIALLAAPSGAALVDMGVTRALVIVIPATLLSAFGLIWALGWLERYRFSYKALSIGLFVILSLINFSMLRSALVDGPTWYDNYGLGGMQYGAQQVFSAVKDYLKEKPGTTIIFSPDWANGADVLARFFLSDPLPIQIGSIDGYLYQHLPLDAATLFIMTPEEYEQAHTSGKFSQIQVEKTLPYPNGQPGFYFAHLKYVDNIDEILAAEKEARRALQETEVNIGGQVVQARFSMLDMGQLKDMFDGNEDTLARTLEANPLVIELTFPEARTISGLSIKIGSTEARVTAQLYSDPKLQPVEFVQNLSGSVDHPEVAMNFDQSVQAKVLHLEIQDLHQEEPSHVHIWEIILR
jgi:hypothetical protein